MQRSLTTVIRCNGSFTNNGGTPSGDVRRWQHNLLQDLTAAMQFINNGASTSGEAATASYISSAEVDSLATTGIINNGATVSGAVGGQIALLRHGSTADSATLIANGGTGGGEGGQIFFEESPLVAHRGLSFSATAAST